MRHLLDVDDLSAEELTEVLDRAEAADHGTPLAGRGVALLFNKPSLRTRHSCEMGVIQLGGHPISVRPDEIGVNDRETPQDIARVLAGYHVLLGARVAGHDLVEALAEPDTIPVVNLLSDDAHPCQALADLLTMRQRFGGLAGRTVAWVGDYNNVARSLARGAALSGMVIRLGCPDGYGPSTEELERLTILGAAEVSVSTRPHDAVKGAEAVHTDVWTSMGFEAEAEARNRAFEGFIVDDSVMAAAAEGAVFMHCLPAHRGEEVAASVIDGPASVVIQQAHNRLHSFRAAAWWLVDEAQAVNPSGKAGGGARLAKHQRQHRVARLLEQHPVTSQQQLVELLAEDGVVATQATVSRDLEEMGAIKVRAAGGDSVYAIPELPKEQRAPEDHLKRVLGEWVVEVAHSANLVVLRTPPGSAHVVGSALDRAALPSILGTVAGDDTLLVVAAERIGGAKVARQLSELAGL